MKRKNSGFVMTSVLLDPKIREEFEKTLPRDVTLADAIREYMKITVETDRKKVEGVSRLPILTSDVRQTTINEYIVNYLNNLLEVSDEDIEKTLKSLPSEKTDRIYEKFGNIRDRVVMLEQIR